DRAARPRTDTFSVLPRGRPRPGGSLAFRTSPIPVGRPRATSATTRVGRKDRSMDTGDTAWLLMSTALVMIMLPGLALFYGGLVRRKNVLSTIMHRFFGLALVSVVWVIVGFSIAFGPDVTLPIIGSGWIGGFDYPFFKNLRLGPLRQSPTPHPTRRFRRSTLY